MKPKEISVILPTIEEESVFGMIDRLRRLLPGCEIIVVDKSGEGYRKRLEKKRVHLIRQTSSGYENALMEGFKAASGILIATIDPDGTYDPRDLVREISYLKKNGLDMVLGNRLRGKNSAAMAGHINFGNRNLTKIYNTTHRTKLHDVLSGVFVMRREAISSIFNVEPYRAGTLFFVMEISKKGFNKISDIPVSYRERPGEAESKLAKSKILYGLGVAGHIVRSTRDYSPLLIFGSIGAILLIAGIVIGLLVVVNYISTGTMNEIGRALIAILLVVIGFLSIISGLILDLLLQMSRKMDKL